VTKAVTYTIYCHTTPSGKRYIGQTSMEPSKRWNNGNGYRSQQFFKRAIDKYGWHNITHATLCTVSSKEYADFLETWFIDRYDTRNPKFGYNVAAGGSGSSGVTWDDERKLKHSTSVSGEGNPMFGRHHTKEAIALMSKNRAKAGMTKEQIQTNTETLLKANKRRRKPIRQLDLDGNLIAIYPGMGELEKETGFKHSAICNVCRGKTNTAYGFKWEYEDENLRMQADKRRRKRSSLGNAVVQLGLDGAEIARFESLSAAERETGLYRDRIGDCCVGGIESYGGYLWRYENEEMVSTDNREVAQLDKNGCVLSSFNSIAEASAATGTPRYQIRNCCRGKKRTANGFMWQFLNSDAGKSVAGTKVGVVQLDMHGNEIGRYPSLTKAMEKTGHDRHRITECCKGVRQSYKGYTWRYESQEDTNGGKPREGLFC